MFTHNIPQDNILVQWEDFKLDVTKYSIKFATMLSREKRHKTNTTKTVRQPNRPEEVTNQNISDRTATRIITIIRSRIETVGSEDLSRYNFTLEQIHGHSKIIKNITHDDGTETTDLYRHASQITTNSFLKKIGINQGQSSKIHNILNESKRQGSGRNL